MSRAQDNRPLSPHLGIYRWQISNTLSILHRLTGVGLTLGLIPLAAWLWGLAYEPALFDWMSHAFRTPLGLVMLAGWMLAFYYHLGNGIRHLNWDIGKGFSIEEMTASGRLVVVFAIAMMIFTAAIIARKVGLHA
jgi:succinate dehydrogenase / fumarate reductase cytochrome b subunit